MALNLEVDSKQVKSQKATDDSIVKPKTHSDSLDSTLSSTGSSKTRSPGAPVPAAKTQISNVVIFGGTGVGKSSLVNMLAGDPALAETSSSVHRVTFGSQCYRVQLGKPAKEFALWDTQGLDGDVGEDEVSTEALIKLGQLIIQLRDSGGVSLLIYCIMGGRNSRSLATNHDLFHGILCRAEVPMLVVVTKLENDTPMDSWWSKNEETLRINRLFHESYVCVTTTRGREKPDGYVFQAEYDTSRVKVESSIVNLVLSVPWMPREEAAVWAKDVEKRVRGYLTAVGGKKKKMLYRAPTDDVACNCIIQ
ncbi:hypothetical protein CPB83DRAFT_822253 [Crepidotus variabilis]|uniref:G domain-containing protein n=1 Tax=Crepidotus variabilis TaxID=179855 RepID=A0A9P6E5G1_9AGAR|nr:hypothetical protein CPB83DRAFT_822253 [Crepidotus variabilis]